MSVDTFWEDIQIPYQEDNKDFQFTNPVAVSQHFVKSVGRLAQVAEQAEVLTDQIATITVHMERRERDLKMLRRKILAKHYKSITKSAGSEIQEAFVRLKAEEEGLLSALESIEAEIEKDRRELEIRIPRVAKLRSRMKAIETTLIWGKQHLDFEKILMRTQHNG